MKKLNKLLTHTTPLFSKKIQHPRPRSLNSFLITGSMILLSGNILSPSLWAQSPIPQKTESKKSPSPASGAKAESTINEVPASKTVRSSEIPDRREFPLNEKINPCENFYDYVCSKVIDSFQLREDRSAHTFSFSDSSERLLKIKKNYFQQLSQAKPSDKKEINLKNFYMSCMNTQDRKKEENNFISQAQKTLKKLTTKEKFLSWTSDNYLNTEPSWITWGTTSNLDTPTINDLYMYPALKSLPEKSYYKNQELMADFKKNLHQFFTKLKVKNPSAFTDSVILFESQLAEIVPTPSEFRQITNNRNFVTREELIKKYPNLNFEKLLKEVPVTSLIRNWIPETLQFLNSYIEKSTLDDLQAIFLYQMTYEIIDESDPQIFGAKFDFRKKYMGGPNQRPELQERCTRKTMYSFSKEIDSILLDKTFPDFDRKKFIGMAEKIRQSLLDSLNANKWLSKEAKAEALKKMASAKLFLVSPQNEKEWNFLPDANYSSKGFIANQKTREKVHIQKNLQELREPNDPSQWDMSPLTVNAYYDPSFNKFVMPIGILQYPFYDQSLSEEENLAAIGSVIGHELGHGIDDQGSRYDFEGKQRQWMTMKDLAEFSKRTEMLIEQFNNAKHNGKLTLGENIGDLVGLTSSLAAAHKNPDFSKNVDMQKKFFISYARSWCEVKRPGVIEEQLKTDPHSLGVARVNEQMKQQALFEKVFSCKKTDEMILPAEKRVSIW